MHVYYVAGKLVSKVEGETVRTKRSGETVEVGALEANVWKYVSMTTRLEEHLSQGENGLRDWMYRLIKDVEDFYAYMNPDQFVPVVYLYVGEIPDYVLPVGAEAAGAPGSF